jgi:hypothetical protein
MAEFAGERAAHQEQLTAARAAADKATAELVGLARRLAAIAETQTSTGATASLGNSRMALGAKDGVGCRWRG